MSETTVLADVGIVDCMCLRLPTGLAVGWLAALLGVLLACCAGCGGASAEGAARVPDHSTPPSEASTVWTGVALGDSVTAGSACGCTAFPALYATAAGAYYGVPVTMQNLGAGGLSSTQLVAVLAKTDSVESRALRSADIDLITIGANDFGDDHDDVTAGVCSGAKNDECTADELRQLGQNITDIVSTIHRDRGSRPTTILITGYWNVFEDGEVARSSFSAAGRAATKKLTASVNQTIEAAAHASGASYVDLAGPYDQADPDQDPTSLLAPDGDHPNAAGHALIARTLVSAGLPGLL